MNRLVLLSLVAVACAGCGGNSGPPSVADGLDPLVTPTFLRASTRSNYDGTTNDLLTGGLGKSGLAAATPPAFADAANPTPAELRTRAIYNNYRALVDTTVSGGYGTLFGPNVDASGQATAGEGRVAGIEYVAYSDDGTGTTNVTLMVQIPSNFDRNAACIIAAPSSGSRGVYGAIGTAGEWGLKRGCAVAYTDKGTGNGAHDLGGNNVYLINGRMSALAAAGKDATFAAPVTDAERTAFNAAFPSRWAFKHAHSQQNPEKDWGKYTLQAIEMAFYVLNLEYSPEAHDASNNVVFFQVFKPDNTLVIASSVSNGGGASLAALEQDTAGLIDGLAVAEPQVQMNQPFTTLRRGGTTLPAVKSLYDYTTLANLYEPCAAYASAAAGAPALAFVTATTAANRCQALADRGLLSGANTTDQANDALAHLIAAGWEPESTPLHASLYAFAIPAIAVTYANTYGRFSVKDNACGFSYAATASGAPVALAQASAVQMWAAGNGIPPTNGVNIVNNNSLGGPLQDPISVTPTTGKQDFNVDGAICLRTLLTSANVAASIDQVKRTGNLRGKPAVIVHGRNDGLVPVNHSSRPYFALNKAVDTTSRLAYYEITNAQHFDAFIGNPSLAGYDTRFVPVHRYFIQAMDLVWNNLRSGVALPPSQVVRTTPRGGAPGSAPPITAGNVPPISSSPAAADLITVSGNVMTIPD
jgi:hydroxybutyrate-dimer hydrolase